MSFLEVFIIIASVCLPQSYMNMVQDDEILTFKMNLTAGSLQQLGSEHPELRGVRYSEGQFVLAGVD